MEYQRELPTQPGYYWVKIGDEEEEIVEVWTDPDSQEQALWVHHCGDGEGCEIEKVTDALWAGPIPHPHNSGSPT